MNVPTCSEYYMFYFAGSHVTAIVLLLMLISFAGGFLTAYASGWALKLLSVLLFPR